MKKIALLLVPILILSILPVNMNGWSSYNSISGALFCNSSSGCWHEIAHRMDDDLGHPSRSAEFGNAIVLEMMFAFKYQADDTAMAILGQEGLIAYSPLYSMTGAERFSSPQEELYAKLFDINHGDVSTMPPAFQKFYSTDEKYTALYHCLMSAEFKLCGTALHREKKHE